MLFLSRCAGISAVRANRCSFAPALGRLASRLSAHAEGVKFLEEADEEEERRRKTRLGDTSAPREQQQQAEAAAEKSDEKLLRGRLRRLFQEIPGHSSLTFAWFLYRKGELQDEDAEQEPLTFEDFTAVYKSERLSFRVGRRLEVARRRRTRRNFAIANEGYVEEEECYEATEEEMQDEWRVKSILEDVFKSKYNQQMHSFAAKLIPEREALAARTDRVADVLAGAMRQHVRAKNRPVLTHELADYENPYMMRRSAVERLLSERCVRNQLDERCLPRLLDGLPDLVKLRARAQLPPEVLEPLAAFRGDTRWSSDPSERMAQKVDSVDEALQALLAKGADPKTLVSALPENKASNVESVFGIKHAWRNHLGFESMVPNGTAGGTKFGQPTPEVQQQVLRTRYPTLQRVAHTLPADPKWRAHVVRSIRVLERSKHWDYQSKLSAINKLKEVYELMKPSDVITGALDDKLPCNRVQGHLRKKFARGVEYYKSYPKNFLRKKSWTRYEPSLTNPKPVKPKSWPPPAWLNRGKAKK